MPLELLHLPGASKGHPALICPIFPGKVSVETGTYIGMGFHDFSCEIGEIEQKLKLQSQDPGKIKWKISHVSFILGCGEEPLPSFQNLKKTVMFDERSRAAVI